ncbi:isoprenylcysteine carboxylmethyltransferase family protein [Phenylobacterium sp.]|uniref:methyltransferase family protein n=1 Tax=Phenylobacterium sp. TaxID=1871053 RepID=UPI0025E20718|nr:isoprenylcysteine carboxylmethyltransferase family protein [Phenylobacterium sp.]
MKIPTGGLWERVYDYAERAFVTVLGVSIISRFLPSLAAHPFDSVLLTSECAAVAMVLFRRRAQVADLSIYAVAIALTGTTCGLLVRPGGGSYGPEWIGGLIMIAGGLLSIAAKVALNRSFGLTAANRGVKREGPYRFMRHPMYAGYIVTQAGFLLANPSVWNAIVYGVAWGLQIARISAEEKVLMQDVAYRDYARTAPFRLVPGLY